MNSGNWYLITAPSPLTVTVEEAKRGMMIQHSGQDTLIGELLAAAVDQLDGPNGWLGRFIGEQTWDYKVDAFPAPGCALKLPLWPVQSITSVKYVDTAGVEQTWDSANYQVTGLTAEGAAKIYEAYGKSWPSTRDQREAVTVRGVFGYDAGQVPADIRRGIILQVKLWLETSGEMFGGDMPLDLFPIVKNALMAKYVWRV